MAVAAAGTSLPGLSGAGPVIAAAVIGDVRDVSRFPGPDHFAACDGTAPIEVSSGPRKIYRLSSRGNRRLNHAIHRAAITQTGHRHSQGRACHDKKLAEGKTPKKAPRALTRQVSNAIFARPAGPVPAGPQPVRQAREGSRGNDPAASAAGSHPGHRPFGQATPGPGHHTTATASPPGRAGHSPIAATPPPATPQVQAEHPQPSEDERPAGAARPPPHPATRKARSQAQPVKPQRPKGTL